jgi:hypothetical protein
MDRPSSKYIDKDIKAITPPKTHMISAAATLSVPRMTSPGVENIPVPRRTYSVQALTMVVMGTTTHQSCGSRSNTSPRKSPTSEQSGCLLPPHWDSRDALCHLNPTAGHPLRHTIQRAWVVTCCTGEQILFFGRKKDVGSIRLKTPRLPVGTDRAY